MDVLTPVITGALLALFTAIQMWVNKGRFDAMDSRIDRLDARIDRLESRIDTLAGEIAQIRSDLLQVVLARNPREQTG